MPPLPGATMMDSTRGDWLSFQARACSRPPLPMRRIRRDEDMLLKFCKGRQGRRRRRIGYQEVAVDVIRGLSSHGGRSSWRGTLAVE